MPHHILYLACLLCNVCFTCRSVIRGRFCRRKRSVIRAVSPPATASRPLFPDKILTIIRGNPLRREPGILRLLFLAAHTAAAATHATSLAVRGQTFFQSQ